MINNRNIYWYFVGILPTHFCDDVIKFAQEKNKEEAQTGFSKKDEFTVFKKRAKKKLLKTRNSTVNWLDEFWIHKELNQVAEHANRSAGWGFYWDAGEAIQFTEYTKGQHYDWHQDRWEAPLNRPNNFFHNTNRVLSMTVNLTDPKEYEGGHLEFATIEKGKLKKYRCTEILPKGSVCVFPSDIWHRVTPVKKGKRISLVKWLSKRY